MVINLDAYSTRLYYDSMLRLGAGDALECANTAKIELYTIPEVSRQRNLHVKQKNAMLRFPDMIQFPTLMVVYFLLPRRFR